MPNLTELVCLVESVQFQIGLEEYADEKYLDEDGEPYTDICIAVTLDGFWDYQTGSNCFRSVINPHYWVLRTGIYKDCDTRKVAQDLLDEMLAGWDKFIPKQRKQA